MSILMAIIALGILILVHELGHYLAARWGGVYVEKFSIGFGPKIWGKTIKDTEYKLSAIPLGGYVKLHRMYEEEEPIAGKEAGAFYNKPYYIKAIVITAGVIFNVIFAVILMMIIFMSGYPAYSPVVGGVTPNMAGELAGFQKGDIIRAVDGKKIRSWEDFLNITMENVGKSHLIVVDRNGEELKLNLTTTATEAEDLTGEKITVGDTGLEMYLPPVIGSLTPGYPAVDSGLKVGDKVVSINGQAIDMWNDVSRTIRANPGVTLDIVYLRGGVESTLTITPKVSEGADGIKIGLIGVGPSEGDLVIRENPIVAAKLGVEKTWTITTVIYDGIVKLVKGKVSADNLGGPIMIVQAASASAKSGFAQYLSFMALISVNLAILNLLPVPVLDGGHLMFFTIERIMGRRLSIKVREKSHLVGFALLGMLMIFALYNDIVRLITK